MLFIFLAIVWFVSAFVINALILRSKLDLLFISLISLLGPLFPVLIFIIVNVENKVIFKTTKKDN